MGNGALGGGKVLGLAVSFPGKTQGLVKKKGVWVPTCCWNPDEITLLGTSVYTSVQWAFPPFPKHSWRGGKLRFGAFGGMTPSVQETSNNTQSQYGGRV